MRRWLWIAVVLAAALLMGGGWLWSRRQPQRIALDALPPLAPTSLREAAARGGSDGRALHADRFAPR